MNKYNDLQIMGNITYYYHCFRKGLQALWKHPRRGTTAILYWLLVLALFAYTVAAEATGPLDKLFRPLACIAVAAGASLLFLIAVTFSVVPRGAWRDMQAFQRIGFVNSAGEPPRLFKSKKLEGEKVMKDYFAPGIPVEQFQKKNSRN